MLFSCDLRLAKNPAFEVGKCSKCSSAPTRSLRALLQALLWLCSFRGLLLAASLPVTSCLSPSLQKFSPLLLTVTPCSTDVCSEKFKREILLGTTYKNCFLTSSPHCCGCPCVFLQAHCQKDSHFFKQKPYRATDRQQMQFQCYHQIYFNVFRVLDLKKTLCTPIWG